MIALLLALQVLSPAPPPYVAPVVIERPPDYRGICHAREKGVPIFDYSVAASGKGRTRRLVLQSSDPRLPSGKASGFQARQVGNRTIEHFNFRPHGRNWVASVEWRGQGIDVWMSIAEPIVIGKPIRTEWFARCELEFGAAR